MSQQGILVWRNGDIRFIGVVHEHMNSFQTMELGALGPVAYSNKPSLPEPTITKFCSVGTAGPYKIFEEV